MRMKNFYHKLHENGSKHSKQRSPKQTIGDCTFQMPFTGSVTATPKACLENIPVELRLCILLNLEEIASLRALMHASPLYHRAYSSQHRLVLSKILFYRASPDVLVDALTAVRSPGIRRREKGDDTRAVGELLDTYKAHRGVTALTFGNLPLDEIVSLAQLHGVIESVVQLFCEWASSAHSSSGEAMTLRVPLSSSEKRRFQRALYRFEIFCRLFRSPYEFGDSPFDTMDQSHRFLALFPPWEVKEIACVRDYFIYTYHQMFKRYEEELIESWESDSDAEDYVVGSRLQHNGTVLMRVVNNSKRLITTLDTSLPFYEENCMTHGLAFLLKASRATQPEQFKILRGQLNDVESFLSQTLIEPPYDFSYPGAAYRAWTAQEEIRLSNDFDSPNAAWTWATGNKVEIFYAEYNKEVLRRWAYVMWDRPKLEQWGILNESNEQYMSPFEQ